MIKRLSGVSLACVLLSTVLVLGIATTVQAITFGPNCGSGNCFGSIYTLTAALFSSTATTETYNVTLSVNTAGYNGSGTGLDAVAFKTVSNTTDILSASLGSQPGTFGSTIIGGLSANGCSAGSAGFVCTQSSNLGGVTVPNGTYTFGFSQTINSGQLLNENEWSIKALYVDSAGKQAGLTSVSGAVPIPETLLLFGVGFSLFVLWHQRSRRWMTLQS
jgi:hypothetical protein